MSQGKARDKEKTIEALKPYFKMGCSVIKACNYGGVPQSTVATWIEQDEALRTKITAWQNEPNVLARSNWIAKMAEGDYVSSKDWISKKEKDEFSDRVEQTGANGSPLIVQFDNSFSDATPSPSKTSSI
jgi:hypothetical protein